MEMEKRKLRSRAYPSVPLKEAVELLQSLTAELGLDFQEQSAIADAWGYGSNRSAIADAWGYRNSGVAARKTAALVHFGLLALRDGLYYPTDLAKEILDEVDKCDGAALVKLFRQAFLSSTLFREILLRYEAVGRIPQNLAQALTLDHGIQENAREEVVKIFFDSAVEAGVLDADGRFRDEYFEATGRPRPLSRQDTTPAVAGDPAAEPAAEREQIFEFQVTGERWVTIHVPGRLNETDLRMIRLQIELLELQHSSNRPAQPVRLLRKEPQG